MPDKNLRRLSDCLRLTKESFSHAVGGGTHAHTHTPICIALNKKSFI